MHKTADEMRISDWSSVCCSSDLGASARSAGLERPDDAAGRVCDRRRRRGALRSRGGGVRRGEGCGPRKPCGTGAARSEGGTIGLVERGAPALPDALHVVKQAACVQMIAPHLSVPETGFHVVPLGDADAAEMLDRSEEHTSELQ